MRVERIPVEGGTVSASVHGASGTLVVLGHGAGGTREQPALVHLAETLAASGRQAVLFNFPYSERRGRRPDPPALLHATVRAVAGWARSELGAGPLVVGGRSMGGRMAATVAPSLGAAAVVLLAYPLHPPGRPDQLRDAPLRALGVPFLVVQGTRDAFAEGDLLERTLAPLSSARLHRVQGGDHSFGVLKSAGRSPAEVRAEVEGAVTAWLDERAL